MSIGKGIAQGTNWLECRELAMPVPLNTSLQPAPPILQILEQAVTMVTKSTWSQVSLPG
jgi:hypothetical protein